MKILEEGKGTLEIWERNTGLKIWGLKKVVVKLKGTLYIRPLHIFEIFFLVFIGLHGIYNVFYHNMTLHLQNFLV